jgi:MOSC domain-containing protein YiiM
MAPPEIRKELLSVNVGKPRRVEHGGRTLETAIFKSPVEGRRRVGRLNVDGDAQADLKHHGGPEQAVYAYPVEHYPAWSADLGGRDLGFGTFGENLTVRGLLEDEVRVGDRLRVGSTELVVTNPRIPCAKFAMRLEYPEAPKRMFETGRCGFYLSVAVEGDVGAGDGIRLLRRDPDAPTIREVFRKWK